MPAQYATLLDTFNRADGALGGNWAPFSGGLMPVISSNRALIGDAVVSALWVPNTFSVTGNSGVEIAVDISAFAGTSPHNPQLELLACYDPNDSIGYRLVWSRDSISGIATLSIDRDDLPTRTDRPPPPTTLASGTHAFSATDSVSLVVFANGLIQARVYSGGAWHTVCSVSDSVYSEGSIGLLGGHPGPAHGEQVFVDNFYGGSFLIPPPVLSLSSNTVATVDLATGFDDSDFVSIALPSFPLSKVDLTQSTVRFTSKTDGSFDGSPNTCSVPFTANINAWIEGDVELRFPRSLLFTGLVGDARTTALEAVTGVQFNVQARTACTFRCLAVRLVGKNWESTPLDIDTRYQRLEHPPTADGSLTAPQFPSSTVNGLATDFPILYWADDPPGKADPRPINSSVSAAFNAGSFSSASGATNYAAQFNLPGAVLVGDLANLRFSTAFTLEAWIKPDNLSNTRAIVTKWQDVAGKRGYRFGVTTAGELELQYSTDGTATTTVISTGAAISTSTWQHVAVTFQIIGSGGVSLPLIASSTTANKATVTFYKNSVPVGGGSGLPGVSVFNTDRPFKIGAWNTG